MSTNDFEMTQYGDFQSLFSRIATQGLPPTLGFSVRCPAEIADSEYEKEDRASYFAQGDFGHLFSLTIRGNFQWPILNQHLIHRFCSRDEVRSVSRRILNQHLIHRFHTRGFLAQEERPRRKGAPA